MHLLVVTLIYDVVEGNLCFPCICQMDTMDCSFVDKMTYENYINMANYRKVIIPTHLITRHLVQLRVTVQPIDPLECDIICAIPGLKSTCMCEVSLPSLFPLIQKKKMKLEFRKKNETRIYENFSQLIFFLPCVFQTKSTMRIDTSITTSLITNTVNSQSDVSSSESYTTTFQKVNGTVIRYSYFLFKSIGLHELIFI